MEYFNFILLVILWIYLFFIRFFYQNKESDYVPFLNFLLINKYFYKLSLFKLLAMIGYILIGLKSNNYIVFIFHILIFLITTIKLKYNNEDKITD
jgi:hypothetical protein